MEKTKNIMPEKTNTKNTRDTKAMATMPKKRGLWLSILSLFVLFLGSVWFLQEQQLMQTAKIIALTKQLEKAAQIDDIVKLNQRQIEVYQTLSQSIKAATSKIDKLAQSEQLTENDILQSWALAEIEFLLLTANQSVLLKGDIKSAITSLTLADERLTTLTDPRLYELRSLISDEKLALMSIDNLDIEGLAAQIQSAVDAIDTLQIPADLNQSVTTENTENKPAEEAPSDWRALLSSIWQQVRSLIVIRRQQTKDAVFLPPDKRYFLYQNLRLKLETARAALLSGDEELFRASLATADQWLQQYFINQERDAMLAMIKSLQKKRITKNLPDISASLRWLQQYKDEQ